MRSRLDRERADKLTTSLRRYAARFPMNHRRGSTSGDCCGWRHMEASRFVHTRLVRAVVLVFSTRSVLDHFSGPAGGRRCEVSPIAPQPPILLNDPFLLNDP